MKLASYRHHESPRIGLSIEDWIFDLAETLALMEKEVTLTSALLEMLGQGNMLGLIEAGESQLKILASAALFAQRIVDKGVPSTQVGKVALRAEDIELMAPIPRPRKNIVCLGLNYRDHWAETLAKRGEPLPSVPVFFTKAPTAVIGPHDDVVCPASSNKLDYEVELAFVIGKAGKNIPRRAAYDHVVGYTIMNDVTARDLQRSHVQWFKGKSLDTFAPLGPYLVTRDEITDPHRLGMRLLVNGNTRQQSNTADMIFKIDQIVEVLSSDMTLEPGDIVATGTPAGVGSGMTPPQYLCPGDVIETQIERIGTLRNKIVAAN